MKQIQRDRNEQSLEDYAKDLGLEPDYEVFEEWIKQVSKRLDDEDFEPANWEDYE